MLAALDGIINKVERRLIQFLRFVNFPLFCMELWSFVVISMRVIDNWDDIDKENRRLGGDDGGDLNPNYCEGGTWQLMVAVLFVYSLVIIFRVAVIVASLIS